LFEKAKRGKSQTAIPYLKEYNLIIEKDGLYGARIFSLTEKGKCIAQHLLEIDKILKEK